LVSSRSLEKAHDFHGFLRRRPFLALYSRSQ